jgi:hypothetical protein
MSVLNDMLRNLESRGAGAHVTGLAAAARPAAGGFAGAPRPSRRIWIWSATAFVVGGVVAGLTWQEQQARSAHERRKPLGWSTYGAAIAQSATPATSLAMSMPVPAVAPAAPAAPAASAASAISGAAPTAAVPNVAAPVATPSVAVMTAPAAPAASPHAAGAAPVPAAAAAPERPAAASPPQAARAATSRAAPGAAAEPGREHAAAGTTVAEPAASISISATAPKERTGADLARAGDLIARGRNSEAVPLLAQVLAREPAHAPARAALVALLAENGQRERALALLIDGVQIDAARFAAPAAQLQAELGDVAGALATLDRVPAARRAPAHYALLGGLAQRHGQSALAVDAYARAVASNDALPVWWVGLGLAHEALGQAAQARAAFVRAQAQPTLPADVRAFVAARLQAAPVATRTDAATVAATAP